MIGRILRQYNKFQHESNLPDWFSNLCEFSNRRIEVEVPTFWNRQTRINFTNSKNTFKYLQNQGLWFLLTMYFFNIDPGSIINQGLCCTQLTSRDCQIQWRSLRRVERVYNSSMTDQNIDLEWMGSTHGIFKSIFFASPEMVTWSTLMSSLETQKGGSHKFSNLIYVLKRILVCYMIMSQAGVTKLLFNNEL